MQGILIKGALLLIRNSGSLKSSLQNVERRLDLHTCHVFKLDQFLYFSLFHGKSFNIKKIQARYYLRNLYTA